MITRRLAGIVVVDCDCEQDTTWWQSSFLQRPLVVRTGGGAHLYYRHPEEPVRNRSGLFGRCINLRADGGLVIAPPSIHPTAQRAYRWEKGTIHSQNVIPRFNIGWVAEREPRGTSRHPQRLHGDSAIRDGLAYIRRIESVAGNVGHNATVRAACNLRDSGLTADEALDALLVWNRTNASPPWSAKELAHKVEDTY